MQHLLNLLAAIALLVWGTNIVRTGMLKLYGASLRQVIASSVDHRVKAMGAGFAVTSLVQSSTATCLIVASFLGRGLIATAPALAVMLGADVGTSAMVIVFSFDLSWLSPLLIFVGVMFFVGRESSVFGRIGRVVIGFGLILLSLQLIVAATQPLIEAPAVRQLIVSLPNEPLLDIVVGAALTVLAYSSLAIVLLTATLAGAGLVPVPVALGLVLGANIGSGVLAVLATARSDMASRRLPVGNLAFKVIGTALALPLLQHFLDQLKTYFDTVPQQVVAFHFGFNVLLALTFIGFTGTVARRLDRWMVAPAPSPSQSRPHHLDPVALPTPALAIGCAAREALHQADVVETMLRSVIDVIKTNDLTLAEELRRMDDTVDELYTAIKFYLTQISREALSEREGKRWADIVSFTINMEQIGDIVERIVQDVEDKKIRHARSFSEAGMAEICHLHECLIANLRLAMTVFLEGNVADARKLLEEKARFRDLERGYAARHIARLQDNTAQSIETSSLHLDLISDLKRINSLICSVAYPILHAAGALADTRIRESRLAELGADEAAR
jgi:phosphate:Na+ symporter